MSRHGFSVVRERELGMLGVHARLLRHDGSGAELLHLAGDEPNLSFAVGFATLPQDDTGVAHILEHMVLAGSERFPLKDPFFEMVKGSVAGFINAMTWPDRTVYPFATDHPKDFLNLLQVYLDAVFRPRLTRETFDQEAWHLEPGEERGSLRWRGVVFNEMKGAAGNPDRALSMTEAKALLGDTPYRHDSGGDPAAIPELTFEGLRAFHHDHYHPSRARFVVHGDVDLDATLEVIAGYLEGAPRLAPLPPPGLPARLAAPVQAHGAYPSDARGKAIATVSWAGREPAGPADVLLWRLLERVVVGTPAAPLRRALLDAGLGEAFVGGFSDARRTPLFEVGLRGVETDRAPDVHALVLATLRSLAERGLDDDDVAAARNRLEFVSRELDVYGGQRGLAAALTAMGVWFHGRDPVAELDFDATFAELDARLRAGPGAAVTDVLRRWLLEEPHRADLTIVPDPDLSARRERDERARLAKVAAGLDPEGLERVRAAAEALEAHQRQPDAEAAKAALPRLKRDDLAEVRQTPDPRPEARGGAEVLWIDRPTRGLVYLDLAFDLRALPDRLLPHVGVLGRALLETGTARSDLAGLSRRIDRDTGGITHALEAHPGIGGGDGVARFVLRGKALAARVGALTDLLAEVLGEARLDDRDAIRRLAVEDLSRRRTALEPSGHQFVMRRLAAHGSPEARIAELVGGLTSLDALATLVRRIDDDWETVRGELMELRGRLLARGALVAGVTADPPTAEAAEASVGRLVDGLPAGDGGRPAADLPAPEPREGWVLPGQVHYVGARWTLRDGGRLPGSWLAAARHVSADVLIPTVRFRGGAYGAGAVLDPLAGALTSWSYRDPNLAATLDVFLAAPQHLREAAAEIDDRALDTLIVGAVGKLDPYELPGASGYRALLRHLRGSAGELERLRADLLATTRRDFLDLADAIEAADPPPVAVLGPRPSLEAAVAAEEDGAWTVREPA
jgi:presequence protease